MVVLTNSTQNSSAVSDVSTSPSSSVSLAPTATSSVQISSILRDHTGSDSGTARSKGTYDENSCRRREKTMRPVPSLRS